MNKKWLKMVIHLKMMCTLPSSIIRWSVTNHIKQYWDYREFNKPIRIFLKTGWPQGLFVLFFISQPIPGAHFGPASAYYTLTAPKTAPVETVCSCIHRSPPYMVSIYSEQYMWPSPRTSAFGSVDKVGGPREIHHTPLKLPLKSKK